MNDASPPWSHRCAGGDWRRARCPGGTVEPDVSPAWTRLDSRMSNGGEALAPMPKSSQATVTWPPAFWLITSCGCVVLPGPKLPPTLTVVTPLKASDCSFARRIGNRGPDDQLGPVRVEARSRYTDWDWRVPYRCWPRRCRRCSHGDRRRPRAGWPGPHRRPGPGWWPRRSR